MGLVVVLRLNEERLKMALKVKERLSIGQILRGHIIERVREGYKREHAARLVGIDEKTLKRWLKMFPVFMKEIERAESEVRV